MALLPALGVETTGTQEDIEHIVDTVVRRVSDGLYRTILVHTTLAEVHPTVFIVVPYLIHGVALTLAGTLTEIQGHHIGAAITE